MIKIVPINCLISDGSEFNRSVISVCLVCLVQSMCTGAVKIVSKCNAVEETSSKLCHQISLIQ